MQSEGRKQAGEEKCFFSNKPYTSFTYTGVAPLMPNELLMIYMLMNQTLCPIYNYAN